MTLWILWSIATSALIAAGAAALDRAASYVGVPRRLVWEGAIVAVLIAPFLVALRSTPSESRPVADAAGSTASQTFTPTPSASTVATRPLVLLDAPGAIHQVTSRLPNAMRRSQRAEWRETIARSLTVVDRADGYVIRAWIAASSILLALFATAVFRLAVRRSRWTAAAESALGGALIAPDVGPAVVGFLRPRVVLPSWALDVDARMRELLLRHELEHVRAGDTRTLLIAELTIVTFPWNAALWWMVRRLRLAIEMDCDARVIQAVGGVYEYASMLIAVGERYSTGLPLAASLIERRPSLEARIEAMTGDHGRRPVTASVVLLGVAIMTLVTAAWTPRPDPLHRPSMPVRPPARRASDSAGAIRPAEVRPRPVPSSNGDTAGSIERIAERPTSYAPVDPKPVGTIPSPIYPEQLRRGHVEGQVVLKFRTDAHGAPDATSIQILQTSSDLLSAAVRSALRTWHFDSAGQVRLAFQFRIASPGSCEPASGAPGTYVDPITGEAFEPVLITACGDFTNFAYVYEDGAKIARTYQGAARDSSAEDSVLTAVGYLQRKQAGRGFFINGQLLDRRASSFSQMLRIVPGLRISPAGDGHTYVIDDASNPTGGCVNTFIDGTLWQSVTRGDLDEHVRPAEVLGIEAYDRSETPSQFTRRDGPACTTVVVWTNAWRRPRSSRSGAPKLIYDDTLFARTTALLRAVDSASTPAGSNEQREPGTTGGCAMPDSIAIRGLSRLRDADVRSTLGVAPRTRISGPVLAQALERLYATNQVVPNASVTCEVIDGQVLAVFYVTERLR